MFDDVQSEVAAKATPQEGASHMLRRVLDRIEAALNGNEWNKARALIEDARGRADAFANAIMHKGEAGPTEGAAPIADDPQAVREDAQRLSQGAVSGVAGGEPGMVPDQGEGGDTGRPGWMATGGAAGAGPHRVGGGWVG